MNIVTTKSEKQVENSRENANEVEEISGEKKVKVEKNTRTPPEKVVVKEVKKESPYVAPTPYKLMIPFP